MGFSIYFPSQKVKGEERIPCHLSRSLESVTNPSFVKVAWGSCLKAYQLCIPFYYINLWWKIQAVTVNSLMNFIVLYAFAMVNNNSCGSSQFLLKGSKAIKLELSGSECTHVMCLLTYLNIMYLIYYANYYYLF